MTEITPEIKIKTSNSPVIQGMVDQEVIKLHKKNPNSPLRAINEHARDRVAWQLKQERLRQEVKVSKEMSTIDALTQLPNRRWFEDALRISRNKAARALRESNEGETAESNFFLIAFDVDRLKSANDTLGHHTGDEILRIMSQLEKREDEPIARVGGDEFAQIINSGMTEKDIGKLIERYKKKFGELAKKILTEEYRKKFGEPPIKEVELPTLSLSFGVAQYKRGLTEEQWRKAADKASYAAKDAGKNRVYIADVKNGGKVDFRELPMTS